MSMGNGIVVGLSEQKSLSKLFYVICGAIVLTELASRVLERVLLRPQLMWAIEYDLLVAAALSFIVTSGVVLLYSRSGIGWTWDKPRTKLLPQIGFGLLLGALVSLFEAPFLAHMGTTLGPPIVLLSRILSPVGAPILLLLLVLLPTAGEIVFRGILFRTLTEHVAIPAAILASSLLFACYWPLFHPLTRFVFAALSAVMYYRTRSLLPSIIAQATIVSSECLYVFYRFNHSVRG